MAWSVKDLEGGNNAVGQGYDQLKSAWQNMIGNGAGTIGGNFINASSVNPSGLSSLFNNPAAGMSSYELANMGKAAGLTGDALTKFSQTQGKVPLESFQKAYEANPNGGIDDLINASKGFGGGISDALSPIGDIGSKMNASVNTVTQGLGKLGLPTQLGGKDPVKDEAKNIASSVSSAAEGGGMGSSGLAPYLSPIKEETTLHPSMIQQSPWQSMALAKQGAEQNQLMDAATANAASANAQAQNALAMKGGLRSGAAERLARGGANDMALAKQNILGQGVIARNDIGMNAANMNTDINKFNAGQNQASDVFNAQNRIADTSGQNAYNQFQYGEGMKLKGANATANAIQGAGKK